VCVFYENTCNFFEIAGQFQRKYRGTTGIYNVNAGRVLFGKTAWKPRCRKLPMAAVHRKNQRSEYDN